MKPGNTVSAYANQEPDRALALVLQSIETTSRTFRRRVGAAIGVVGLAGGVVVWHVLTLGTGEELRNAFWTLNLCISLGIAFGALQAYNAMSSRKQLQSLRQERRVYESALELVDQVADGSPVPASPDVALYKSDHARHGARAKLQALEEKSTRAAGVFLVSILLALIGFLAWCALLAWEIWQHGWDISWWKWTLYGLPMDLFILLAPPMFFLHQIRLTRRLDAARAELNVESDSD